MMKLESSNYTDEYFLDNNKRLLFVIFPGGGYNHTSVREGRPVAKMINDFGYHAVVFNYRETLLKYPYIFDEGYYVLDYYRNHPLVTDIIVMGFSAGGHFASYLLCKHPNLMVGGVLCYPVISTDERIRHHQSFKEITGLISLGHNRINHLSTDLLVDKRTPPVFIWHCEDDGIVNCKNTTVFVNALIKHDVSCEAHIFPRGKHGASIITEETVFPHMKLKDYFERNASCRIWTTYLKDWIINLEGKLSNDKYFIK